jgi:hypothetical protein
VSILSQTVHDPPTWLVVAGHYPVYSIGEHGDTDELKTYLVGLLEEYHVHAYLCGHVSLRFYSQFAILSFNRPMCKIRVSAKVNNLRFTIYDILVLLKFHILIGQYVIMMC